MLFQRQDSRKQKLQNEIAIFLSRSLCRRKRTLPLQIGFKTQEAALSLLNKLEKVIITDAKYVEILRV